MTAWLVRQACYGLAAQAEPVALAFARPGFLLLRERRFHQRT